MVKDPARAEELVQETLLTAYKKLPEFEGNARFGTWIFSIARNLCLNAVRRRADLLTEDGVLDAEDPSIDVVARLGIEERSLWLQRAASIALNPIEQEAVYLRYVEGMPQDAITEALGLGGTGARGLLQRCRRKLQRELQTQLTEMGRGVSFLHEG
jgi:RNA polymerase sigma-70 factor, ECF subfamily